VTDLVELSIVRLPGVAWVHLTGELDLLSRGAFEREIHAVPPAEVVVLDARGLTFCDVIGLRALTAAIRGWAGRGRVAHCILPPAIEHIARLASFDELLEHAERPEALATLAGETIFGLGSEVGGRGPVAAA
jgi:anti-anti-sigma regulatory factor